MTRGLRASSYNGSRAPHHPASRQDSIEARRTAPSMSLHRAAGSADASAGLRAGWGQDRGRQVLRGRSTNGRAAGGERPPADAGQVVPTMPRQRLPAPPQSSAAAHRWHAQADAASLTKVRRELARRPPASDVPPPHYSDGPKRRRSSAHCWSCHRLTQGRVPSPSQRHIAEGHDGAG